MKLILFFEIVDMGIREGMETPRDELLKKVGHPHIFNGYAAGVGTDAESALDDMFNLMEDDYDITELEGQIKKQWSPSLEEGNGRDFFYHFGIVFKWSS